MAYFDRFDICAAHYWVAVQWHGGQGSELYDRLGKLGRMRYEPGVLVEHGRLNANAREIAANLCERLQLGDGGYKPCACEGCFDTAIGWGFPLCGTCQEAGCGESSECKNGDPCANCDENCEGCPYDDVLPK